MNQCPSFVIIQREAQDPNIVTQFEVIITLIIEKLSQ